VLARYQVKSRHELSDLVLGPASYRLGVPGPTQIITFDLAGQIGDLGA
jgi:hypothetical protein